MREDSNIMIRRNRRRHHRERCEGRHRCRLTVFVIAHPDDESMFFVPTIHHFVQQRQKSKRNNPKQQQQRQDDLDSDSLGDGGGVWLICLTSGNYNGLGTIRSQELHRTCRDILGIDKVILMKGEEEDEDAIFFDHPCQSWDVEKASQCLLQTIQEALLQDEHHKQQQQQQAVQVIDFITFDELGVSGHVNHRDTYRTVKCLCEKQQQQHFQKVVNHFPRCNGWALETEQKFISKYLPLYSWILLLFSMFTEPQAGQDDNYNDDDSYDDDDAEGSVRMVYRLHQPWINWNAMRSHASQFVWYRRLFVIFSSYTYVNILKRMDMITHPQPLQQQNEKQKSQ